jgi:chromosome segregation ATPase
MLKAIWRWWTTPMVPKSLFDELALDHLELLRDRESIKENFLYARDETAQFSADLDDAKAERDAMRLDRDKAIGKFEYVEAAKKELEAKLADRDSYVRLLESELKRHTEDESEEDDDEYCHVCGNPEFYCDCGDDE